MNLRAWLQRVGILKTEHNPYIVAECERFKNETVYQQYLDEAQFNIITQLHSLQPDDIEGFQRLKQYQQALDGLSDFVDAAITSVMMRNRN